MEPTESRTQIANTGAPPRPAAGTVLFHPELKLLDAMLSSLDRDGRRLYVFVNAPLEPAAEARLAAAANVCIIGSATNVGLGAALNAIMERASADGCGHIMLLDQDSTPAPELPKALLARFLECDTPARPLAQIGPVLVPPPGETYLPIRYAWRRESERTVHFLPTSGSLISTAAWNRIGPFRADYFIAGIDVEWGFRAWSAGYASVVAREVEMVHRWGMPEEDAAGRPQFLRPQILRQSDVRNYYYIRNAVDCLKLRHIPARWKAWQALTMTAQIGRLLYERRGSAASLGMVSSALADGLRNRLGPIPQPRQAGGG